jgi:hypothetical protein
MKIVNKTTGKSEKIIAFANGVINNLPTNPGFSLGKINFITDNEFKYSIFDTGITPIKI